MCCLKLDEPLNAHEWLLDSVKYMAHRFHSAFFYMGHTYSSFGELAPAITCYTYSLQFERIPDCVTSLIVIKEAADFNADQIEQNPEIFLKRYDIPILKEQPEIFKMWDKK